MNTAAQQTHAITVTSTRLVYMDRRWLLLLAVAALLCLNNLGGYRPLTTHEVLVAQTAREMQQSGQWLIPRYFGEPRLTKPPLAYWEAMSSYWLTGGPSEWAARLPSAVAGMVLTMLVAFFAARHYGETIGLLAGVAHATMLYVLLQARLAEVDMTLAMLVAVAILCYGKVCVAPARARAGSDRSAVVGFWIASGLTVLAKGPVGPLLIGSVVLSHAMSTALSARDSSESLATSLGRGCRSLAPLASFVGVVSFLALALGWPVAVWLQEPRAVEIWLAETVGRFQRDPNAVTRHPFYYPWAALWLTVPWTPFWLGWLGSVVEGYVRRKVTIGSVDALLLCWLLAPMGILSLSAGKQEHYLIPALAPCCVWSALGLVAWRKKLARSQQRSASSKSRWRLPESFARPLGSLLAKPALLGVMVFGILLLQTAALPRIHGRRLAAQWATTSLVDAPVETPVIALGHSVHWLSFYVDRPLERVDSLEEFFDRSILTPQWVLTTRQAANAIQGRLPVLESREAPADPRVSADKTPVVILVASSNPRATR